MNRKPTFKRGQTGDHPIRVYSDASYANNLPDRRSYSGDRLFPRPPSGSAVQTRAWLDRLWRGLSIPTVGRPVLLGDNVSSHFLVRNASLHRRSKHIDVRYHLIRERYEKGAFTLEFVSGKENPADILTKALGAELISLFITLAFG